MQKLFFHGADILLAAAAFIEATICIWVGICICVERLSSEVSSPDSEVLYSLLSIPSAGIKGAVAASVTGAMSAEKLVKGGRQVADWWNARKYSFLSKGVGQARKAKGLHGEITRVFGEGLADDEISLLDRMERIDGCGT